MRQRQPRRKPRWVTVYYMFMKYIAVSIAGIFGVGGRAGAHIICFQGTWR